MTRNLPQTTGLLLLGGTAALGANIVSTASAEELRIGYLAPATGIFAQVGQSKGKFPGAEAFIKQLAAVKVDSPRGSVSIDEMRNPVQNICIKKIEKKKTFGYTKAELWNTVIKTNPHVNQFGQFKKDELLKTPVYSRDFPSCKYCN